MPKNQQRFYHSFLIIHLLIKIDYNYDVVGMMMDGFPYFEEFKLHIYFSIENGWGNRCGEDNQQAALKWREGCETPRIRDSRTLPKSKRDLFRTANALGARGTNQNMR